MRLRAAIIPSGGISPDVTVAACRFVTMCLRPMTRAFLKVANGPASRQAIRISIPMPRNGNRPFPIRSVMQDGQETGCNSSTMPMTDSITPSIIISTVTVIKKGKKQTKKAYAYEIHVTKSWDNEEVVYEDLFDSYSIDLNTFKAQLNALLSEFNENEDGYVYYIASDSRNYYQATNEEKLKGCETVTISVTCSDGATLGQGTDPVQVP